MRFVLHIPKRHILQYLFTIWIKLKNRPCIFLRIFCLVPQLFAFHQLQALKGVGYIALPTFSKHLLSREPPWPVMFTMPNREIASSSLPWIAVSGLVWSVYKSAKLCRAVDVCDASATELPFGTIREELGISSRFPVSISSWCDLRL